VVVPGLGHRLAEENTRLRQEWGEAVRARDEWRRSFEVADGARKRVEEDLVEANAKLGDRETRPKLRVACLGLAEKVLRLRLKFGKGDTPVSDEMWAEIQGEVKAFAEANFSEGRETQGPG
jgi:hypothetical protein